MTRRIERLLLAWLRAVAPRGWSDTVVGDLREDLDARGRGSRARTLAVTATVAARFTLEAAASRLRGPSRTYQTGRRNMDMLTDLRQAARALWRTPGFSLVAILTLALAIGANTAIYSALSSIVLNPLPFKDGNRYVLLWRFNAEMGGIMVTPPLGVAARWRGATHVFEAVETYWGKNFVLTGSGEPEDMAVTLMGPSTLRTLGVQPALGRSFADADFEPSAAPVVLISHALWQSRFGGDRGIAGGTVSLSGTPHTIIGVMPPRFILPMGSDVVWAAARRGVDDRVDHGVSTLAKLAPGVTVEQAQAALTALPASAEGEDDEGWSGRLMTPADQNGNMKPALFVLSGAVGLLLLIACVNVANLILTRYGARRREVALRHALGASRGRLVRYLLAESALLAAAGGAAGLVVAHVGLSTMSAMRPRNLDVLERLAIDPNALLFASAATLATVLLFGLVPAITASRADLQEVLKAGGRASTSSGQGVRGALTVAQVALALILLVGAGLLLRSYGKLTAVNPGFDPSGVLSVRVSLPASRYPVKDKARRQAFFDEALSSIATLPGVTSAAIGMGVPLNAGIMFGTIELEGDPESKRSTILSGGHVTEDYFSTLSIDLLEGRLFTADDRPGRDSVAIVGRSFARTSWPDASAVGKRFRTDTDGPWHTIVGVVDDVKALSLTGDANDHPQIYLAQQQTRIGYGAFIVRADGDPMALVPAIKTIVWALDDELPMGEIVTAEQVLARATSQSRFNLTLLGIFAACGLVLAVVGVYGVTALYVGQRQREVGIRMALGATRGAVASLVFRQTAILLIAAVVVGGLGAWWLSRYLESLVFATATTDALTFAAAIAAVVIASIAATLVPLRRATSVDPAIVLRAE